MHEEQERAAKVNEFARKQGETASDYLKRMQAQHDETLKGKK